MTYILSAILCLTGVVGEEVSFKMEIKNGIFRMPQELDQVVWILFSVSWKPLNFKNICIAGGSHSV